MNFYRELLFEEVDSNLLFGVDLLKHLDCRDLWQIVGNTHLTNHYRGKILEELAKRNQL